MFKERKGFGEFTLQTDGWWDGGGGEADKEERMEGKSSLSIFFGESCSQQRKKVGWEGTKAPGERERERERAEVTFCSWQRQLSCVRESRPLTLVGAGMGGGGRWGWEEEVVESNCFRGLVSFGAGRRRGEGRGERERERERGGNGVPQSWGRILSHWLRASAGTSVCEQRDTQTVATTSPRDPPPCTPLLLCLRSAFVVCQELMKVWCRTRLSLLDSTQQKAGRPPSDTPLSTTPHQIQNKRTVLSSTGVTRRMCVCVFACARERRGVGGGGWVDGVPKTHRDTNGRWQISGRLRRAQK